MNWDLLQAQFAEATRQIPPPAGMEDAFEWDHSRLGRALGISGSPQLSSLRITALPLVPCAPAMWDQVADRYRSWAEAAGWRSLRISARPSTITPDPVATQLGEALSGPDGLLFAGAANMPRAACGKRPRSAGCSIPLTSGERWTIAIDRVRRRVRHELSTRGLSLVIEDAQFLTPASMGMFVYLANAHRAWQGRMLAFPAPFHAALLCPPQAEPAVADLLHRFGVDPHPSPAAPAEGGGAGAESETPNQGGNTSDHGERACPSDPIRDRRLKLLRGVSVEEEHVLSALADAPFALTEQEAARVFGESARSLAADLATRGLVLRRRELGRACLIIPSWVAAEVPPPPERVRVAVAAEYRMLVRAGRNHLVTGIALLELRRGRAAHAVGWFGRSEPGDGALLSDEHRNELLRRLGLVRSHLRFSHFGALFSLEASTHQYAAAEHAAVDMQTHGPRSEQDLADGVRQILSVGRAHLDRALPQAFWAGLNSQSVDPGLLECVAVASECFCSLRRLSDAELQNRLLVLTQLLHNNDTAWRARSHRTSKCSLQELCDVLVLRLLVRFATDDRRFVEDFDLPGRVARVRATTRMRAVGSYVVGTVLFALVQAPHRLMAWPDGTANVATVLRLVAATANVEDSTIQSGFAYRQWLGRGLRLLLRSWEDHLALLSAQSDTPLLHRSVVRNLRLGMSVHARMSRAGNLLFAPRWESDEPSVDRLYCQCELAEWLLNAGDAIGALALVRVASERATSDGPTLCQAAVLASICAFESLQWEQLEVAQKLEARLQARLSSEVRSALSRWLTGVQDLMARRFGAAAQQFGVAAQTLGDCVPSQRRWFKRKCLQYAALCTELESASGEQLRVLCIRRVCREASASSQGDWSFRVERRCGYHSALSRAGWTLCMLEESIAKGASERDAGLAGIRLLQRATAGGAVASDHTMLQWRMMAPRVWCAINDYLRSRFPGERWPEPTVDGVLAKLKVMSVSERGRGLNNDECGRQEEALLRSWHAVVVREWSRRRCVRSLASSWMSDATSLWVSLRDSAPGGEERLRGFDVEAHNRFCEGVLTLLRARRGGRLCVHVSIRTSEPGQTPTGGCAKQNWARRVAGSREVVEARSKFHFTGSSPGAVEVRRMIRVSAQCDFPVLIVGETGAGKDHAARAIHCLSSRSGREMVVISAATVSDSLVEAELFGHVAGAFTGAGESREGLIARADGSSLLIDELADLSPRVQAALLRVLESGEYRPIGGTDTKRSDFRVIATSQWSPGELIGSGRVRQDLYYRLSTLLVEVPPLRGRGNDCVELAREVAREMGRSLGTSAEQEIASREWSGNVRQLKHCVQTASLQTEERIIDAKDIRLAVRDADPGRANSSRVRLCGTGLDELWTRIEKKIPRHGAFTLGEYLTGVGTSRRTAQRHLSALVARGHVVRCGRGRATTYSVVTKGSTPPRTRDCPTTGYGELESPHSALHQPPAKGR